MNSILTIEIAVAVQVAARCDPACGSCYGVTGEDVSAGRVSRAGVSIGRILWSWIDKLTLTYTVAQFEFPKPLRVLHRHIAIRDRNDVSRNLRNRKFFSCLQRVHFVRRLVTKPGVQHTILADDSGQQRKFREVILHIQRDLCRRGL